MVRHANTVVVAISVHHQTHPLAHRPTTPVVSVRMTVMALCRPLRSQNVRIAVWINYMASSAAHVQGQALHPSRFFPLPQLKLLNRIVQLLASREQRKTHNPVVVYLLVLEKVRVISARWPLRGRGVTTTPVSVSTQRTLEPRVAHPHHPHRCPLPTPNTSAATSLPEATQKVASPHKTRYRMQKMRIPTARVREVTIATLCTAHVMVQRPIL